jgi:hypothetical protein
MKQRFDIAYHAEHATIEPHFCRSWDDEGGCYGTNPDHGYSFEEACDQVATWYEQQAAQWRSREHHECLYYIAHETE